MSIKPIHVQYILIKGTCQDISIGVNLTWAWFCSPHVHAMLTLGVHLAMWH